MVGQVRSQAGLKDSHDRKPIRSYNNPSESMNHVMSTFKKGVVSAKDGKENGLTKLEFTTSVFEEINLKQQEELRLAIVGISEEYELSELVSLGRLDRQVVWLEYRRTREICLRNE